MACYDGTGNTRRSRFPSLSTPSAEASQVTINVDVEPAPVDTDEIAETVVKKREVDGFCVVGNEDK